MLLRPSPGPPANTNISKPANFSKKQLRVACKDDFVFSHWQFKVGSQFWTATCIARYWPPRGNLGTDTQPWMPLTAPIDRRTRRGLSLLGSSYLRLFRTPPAPPRPGLRGPSEAPKYSTGRRRHHEPRARLLRVCWHTKCERILRAVRLCALGSRVPAAGALQVPAGITQIGSLSERSLFFFKLQCQKFE